MIPRIGHFIWIGAQFPWINVLAIKSAAFRGGFEQVILHHTDDLKGSTWWHELEDIPNFKSHLFQPDEFLEMNRYGHKLTHIYQAQTKSGIQSDILRLVLLATEGGVYLDTDTVTINSLTPLCEDAGFFCGQERIAWPGSVIRSKNPGEVVKSVLLDAFRYLFRLIPDGWKIFRHLEDLYYTEVNGAIWGAQPKHPLLLNMIDLILARQQDTYMKWSSVYGPHVLQEVLQNHNCPDVQIHTPNTFYPLPPEISQHWFRPTRHPNLDAVLTDETRVVHWYASVSTRSITPLITPDYVKQNANRQLFSALAQQFV